MLLPRQWELPLGVWRDSGGPMGGPMVPLPRLLGGSHSSLGGGVSFTGSGWTWRDSGGSRPPWGDSQSLLWVVPWCHYPASGGLSQLPRGNLTGSGRTWRDSGGPVGSPMVPSTRLWGGPTKSGWTWRDSGGTVGGPTVPLLRLWGAPTAP